MSGNPVQGIKVQMLEDYDVDSTGGIELRPMYSEEDVLTDESGYFDRRVRVFSYPQQRILQRDTVHRLQRHRRGGERR